MPRQSHGKSSTHLYWIWSAMIQRCTNPKCRAYVNYGNRGIKVCQEWMSSEVFMRWAETNGYKRGLQLDRKNNNGDYRPDNCEFVTRTENLSHTRHNVFATAFGETKTLRQWSRDERCKCGYRRLVKRIQVFQWDHEQAIVKPPKPALFFAFGEAKTIPEWSNDPRCKCTKQQLNNRVSCKGWNIERAIATPVKNLQSANRQ